MSAPKGNKFALGNNGGRPPMYDSAFDMADKIDEYFEDKGPQYDDDGSFTYYNPPSVTGLALFLGFCDRHSLYEYKSKKEFTTIIKRALSCVEGHYEDSLNGKSCTGAIFALKNMGWRDKQEVEHSGEFKINKTTEELEEELKDLGLVLPGSTLDDVEVEE